MIFISDNLDPVKSQDDQRAAGEALQLRESFGETGWDAGPNILSNQLLSSLQPSQ
jgi:hypothetical protein